MSGHLRPIKLDSYKPLRELVCENIRQAIIDGTFSPGERLMEIQLARMKWRQPHSCTRSYP